MIDNLYFETTNTISTRAQAIIWRANGLTFLDLFESSSGKLFAEIIKKCPEEKSILIDFKGIIRFDDHSLDDVYNELEGNRKQVIIFNGETLQDDLFKLKKHKKINITHKSEDRIIILGSTELSNLKELEKEGKEYKDKFIKRTLKNTFKKFSNYQRLSSTPFYANGEFDSKRIIESPKDFMWISFYLSDKLTEIISAERIDNVVLVSASLRGSVFVSILGMLNDLDYMNIDHVGPIHRLNNSTQFLNIESHKNYFYIGDFVFGGTEIKLTKVYVGLNGAKLNYALALGSLFESEAFNDFKLYQLSQLKEIHNEADFKLF